MVKVRNSTKLLRRLRQRAWLVVGRDGCAITRARDADKAQRRLAGRVGTVTMVRLARPDDVSRVPARRQGAA